MKTEISDKKYFIIFISVFYILSLISVFYKCEILMASVLLLFLIYAVVFLELNYKKAVVFYLIFFIGFIRTKDSYNINSLLDEIRIDNAVIEGQIISSKNISNKNQKIKFYIRADKAFISDEEKANLNSKILVNIDLDENIKDNFLIGDYIKLKGNLRPPKNATNPYQFDYKNYLLNNGCKNIIYVKPDNYEKVKNPNDFNIRDIWYKILRNFEITRNKIIKKHSKNIKSPNLEILAGLVFGNETINPDEDIKENFKNSGLLHLLAASGLNVALIYGIWTFCAGLMSLPYYLTILIGAGFVILYTFMTGFPPSILRASLMLLFVLFGKLINRNADSVALVFFVGFLILLFEPKMFFDVGFQLSFAVTLGLIISCKAIISYFDKKDEKFKEKYKHFPRISKYFIYLFSPKNLISIITVPLVAQIWVIPLQIHYFNNIAPFSILANIAVIPFIGILSFIGFISSIFALVPYFSDFIIKIFDFVANPLLTLLIKISGFFSSFKISLLKTSGLSVFQIFAFWGLAFLFIVNLKRNFKDKKCKMFFLILIMVLFLSFIKFDNFSNNLEIIMFDTGNADSFLIKTPKNKYIMIDTGKRTYRAISSGEIIINKYLKNKRINSIEKLIVTHYDMDHAGGYMDIEDSVKTNETILKFDNSHSLLKDEIFDFIKTNNIKYKFAKNNETIYFEPDLNIKTFILDPFCNDENESSIITLLNYKNKNILFMADATALAFRKIENYLPDKIDILKIGHHGAKGSVDFYMLDKIKPDYALISTGVNKFNHPDISTLKILNDKNVKILSSRNYGFIKIILQDNDFKFLHYDSFDKKLKQIFFKQNDDIKQIPFYKTDYMKNFIKNNI